MLANRPSVEPESASRPALSWEETACLLCGRYDHELLAEAADHFSDTKPGLRFAVVKCRRCGLVYTNPRPSADSIGNFYPSDYRPHAPREKRAIRLPTIFWSRLFGRPCPERRGRLPWKGPGRLLDFGCGGGSYLRRMSELGWSVTGIDVSPRAVETVRDELGFAVHLGTLPHPDIDPGSFDVITMWQSLEHVHDPLAIIRAAYELLVPGGMLVVAVPNHESFFARHFGEFWFGLDLPRHLTHFTAATLNEMLSVAGFRVERIRGLVHYHWVQSSARRAADSPGLLRRLLRWRPLARAAAWASYLFGRSDCLVAVAERPT